MDKDTYDHDECSHLNRSKRKMIRIVDVPEDFVFPVSPIMWRTPVELPAELPDDLKTNEVAYDLVTAIDGHYYYVGLGGGTACHTKMIVMSQKRCHHGVVKRIPSRMAHEGYPPTKKCVDCGMVSHMVWGPWLKPIEQP